MARAHGVSHTTVQKIWAARGLKPHRVETFKLSGDPRFEEKLVDVVGLYLNPPENAIVLCMDEKSHDWRLGSEVPRSFSQRARRSCQRIDTVSPYGVAGADVVRCYRSHRPSATHRRRVARC
jgi:hypothetical protein